MELNTDFSQRVVMHGDELQWIDSPMKGVQRKMLDRIGDEVARATSIVRYAPDSHFSPHVHTGGEEFIVLEGVFQDEHGDFPVGSYVRNPPQSSHTPGSESGCVIFVKLWQFDLADRTQIRTAMDKVGVVNEAGREGVSTSTLYQDARETVRLEYWQADASVTINASGGAEIFVLEGSFQESGDTLRQYSWLRVPDGFASHALAGNEGATVWIKTGHLIYAEAPIVV